MTAPGLKIKNSTDKNYFLSYILSLLLRVLLAMAFISCSSLLFAQAEGYSDYNNLEEKLAAALTKLEVIEQKLQKISAQNIQILKNIKNAREQDERESKDQEKPSATSAIKVNSQALQTNSGGGLPKPNKPKIIPDGGIATNSTKNAEINSKLTAKSDETEEEKSYNHAIFLLQSKRIDEAEAQFMNFIDEFPLSELAGIAYYWLGEISFDKKDYRQASVYFLKGYRIKPLGEKAALNLLKLTSALREMKEFTHACSILVKLGQDFPLVLVIKESVNKEKKLLEPYCK